MTKNGVVRSFVENQVLVEIVDEEKLSSHSCNPNTCSTCESCGKKKFVIADLPEALPKENIQIGMWVEVLADNIKYSIAVLITFVLPLIMLFVGFYIGMRLNKGSETKGLLVGGILLAFSLIFAYIFDKSFKASVKITKVMERND